MDELIKELMFIFAGAAIVGTVFMYIRQPILIAYIVVGMLAGPFGFKLVKSANHLNTISEVGIILLLFLLGLDLEPQKLLQLFKKTSIVTLVSSVCFTAITMLVAMAFGFGWFESLIGGAALMFSSTVISLKLIPTTDLHNKYIGELMVSILLMQDILAIFIILLMNGGGGNPLIGSLLLIVKMVALAAAAMLTVKYVLLKLLAKFDTIHEYVFLLALGWCFVLSEVAHLIGLSYEMGAFVAGISLAISPISLFIADQLHHLRDFFLILFFFTIGAKFDLLVTTQVLLPGLLIASLLLVGKPYIFRFLLGWIDEKDHHSQEVGFRLGQGSEFSLLLSTAALASGKISENMSYLIQLTAILTFIISTYYVVLKYPTPVGVKAKLRRD